MKLLQDAWLDAQSDAQGDAEAAPADEAGVLAHGGLGNAIRRWRCLLWRAWKLQGASPGLILIRAFANLFTACIFGTIFHALPPTRASTLGRKGQWGGASLTHAQHDEVERIPNATQCPTTQQHQGCAWWS